MIWNWANDPTVRANAFDSEPILWETHVRWYRSRLDSPGTRFWILEDGGEPVGQIRYDRDDSGNAAEISYSIASKHRGKGYGSALLRMTRTLALAELEVEEIRAVTFAENEASRRAFARSGFRISEPSTSRGRACYQMTWREC
jgi:RimJ/RimL family protein N-acetyltransferase